MSPMKYALSNLWKRKASISFGSVVGLVVGGAYLAAVPPKYTSTMLITASTHGVSSVSESASRNMSLAGSLFGSAQNPDFTRVLALLHSEVVASSLQEKYQVIQQLHPEQWDAETNQWKRPVAPISMASQRLNAIFGRPEWQPPSSETLEKELEKAILIVQSDNKGFYTVSFSAKTPELAHDVLNEAFTEAEHIAREGALKAAAAYVSYLENEMKFATNDETRKGLTDLYVQQEQRKMVLSADMPFAADVVSAPTVPRRPNGLSPSMLLLVSFVAGAAAFFGIGVYRSSSNKEDAFDNLPIAQDERAAAAPRGH